MSFVEVFRVARTVLGVEVDASAAEVRRAYRRKVKEHPPDRDPEGFRKVREAYEHLLDPAGRWEELLKRPTPFTPPPEIPSTPAQDPFELHMLLLRRAAVRLSAADLLVPGDERA